MLHDRLIPALAPIAMLMALTACTPTPAPTATAETGICHPGAAQRLVGRPKISDDEAKRLTGAGSVRQIAPGQPVIQNYSNTRLRGLGSNGAENRHRLVLATGLAANRLLDGFM